MKFKVYSNIEYQVHQPSTFIFNIHALRTANQTILEETLELNPHFEVEEFSSANGANRFVRLEVKENTSFKLSYKATVDSHFRLIEYGQEVEAVPVVKLDGEVIPLLFPSRYCQSDKLQRLAYNQFGHITNVFAQVMAITDWIHENVAYLSGTTDSQTSAHDTITERAGVCRDFAHLGIALCRALSIPARYFTGYSFKLDPPDFHACFEAYIGGHWILFDPTKLAPLNGLVKIANGRDAADAAVATTFGNVTCTSIEVGAESIEPHFKPFWYTNSNLTGLCIE